MGATAKHSKEVVGTTKHSKKRWWAPQNIVSLLARESKRGARHKVGVRGGEGSEREQAGRDPWPNRAGGHSKTCPHKWWGPQNIPLNHHYALPLLSQLRVRGESWEQGVGLLVQEKWWAPQKLAPQVVGTPKHTPQSPLLPTSILLLLTSPDPPWAPKNFLGPQEALGAFGSLQQPWVFSETQRPCFPLLPLTSPCSLLFTLTPSHPLSLPGFPWAPGSFLGPQEDLGAFASLWQPWVFSQTQGLASLAPPHPLSPPEPPWVPGTFLGPQEALGALTSLWQPWVFSQTQGPCFPCSPSPPLIP